MAMGAGALNEIFVKHMAEHKKLINTFPSNLIPRKADPQEIFPGVTDHILYSGEKAALTSTDEESYNIVILGPTGSGKSTLINHLFNETVVESGSSAASVTRHVSFIQGNYIWPYTMWKSGREITKRSSINVIDTLGFCDSLFTPAQVYNMIRTSVKVNIAKIDKVIIVCSGRIESQQAEAIRQFLDWLKYDKYKNHFVFLYNKCESLTEAEKTCNLLTMCQMLKVDPTIKFMTTNAKGPKLSKETARSVAFPPNADYSQVKDDLNYLTSVAMMMPTEERIVVDKRFCNIL